MSQRTQPKHVMSSADDGSAVRTDHTNDPVWNAMNGVRKAWQESGFTRRLMDKLESEPAPLGGSSYWSSDHEIFARTFESWVARKLQNDGRKNTYLSGVIGDGGGYWPNSDEVSQMSDAFDGLMSAYKAQNKCVWCLVSIFHFLINGIHC